jgi:hypothetical protein
MECYPREALTPFSHLLFLGLCLSSSSIFKGGVLDSSLRYRGVLLRDRFRRTSGDRKRESGLGLRRARLRGGDTLRILLDRERDLDLDRDRDRDADRGRRRSLTGCLEGDPAREEWIEEASLLRRLRAGSPRRGPGKGERPPPRRGGERVLPPLPYGDRERDLER